MAHIRLHSFLLQTQTLLRCQPPHVSGACLLPPLAQKVFLEPSQHCEPGSGIQIQASQVALGDLDPRGASCTAQGAQDAPRTVSAELA